MVDTNREPAWGLCSAESPAGPIGEKASLRRRRGPSWLISDFRLRPQLSQFPCSVTGFTSPGLSQTISPHLLFQRSDADGDVDSVRRHPGQAHPPYTIVPSSTLQPSSPSPSTTPLPAHVSCGAFACTWCISCHLARQPVGCLARPVPRPENATREQGGQ